MGKFICKPYEMRQLNSRESSKSARTDANQLCYLLNTVLKVYNFSFWRIEIGKLFHYLQSRYHLVEYLNQCCYFIQLSLCLHVLRLLFASDWVFSAVGSFFQRLIRESDYITQSSLLTHIYPSGHVWNSFSIESHTILSLLENIFTHCFIHCKGTLM